jgi:hypothetical protein
MSSFAEWGKDAITNRGIKGFRAIIGTYVDQYVSAKTKIDKSITVQQLVNTVQQQDTGNLRFLKFDKTNVGTK